jgi:hypothetical protein
MDGFRRSSSQTHVRLLTSGATNQPFSSPMAPLAVGRPQLGSVFPYDPPVKISLLLYPHWVYVMRGRRLGSTNVVRRTIGERSCCTIASRHPAYGMSRITRYDHDKVERADKTVSNTFIANSPSYACIHEHTNFQGEIVPHSFIAPRQTTNEIGRMTRYDESDELTKPFSIRPTRLAEHVFTCTLTIRERQSTRYHKRASRRSSHGWGQLAEPPVDGAW